MDTDAVAREAHPVGHLGSDETTTRGNAMHASGGSAANRLSISTDDRSVAIGALVHDLFGDAEGAGGRSEATATRGDISPAYIFAVTEDISLLLAEVDSDTNWAGLTTAVPNIEWAIEQIDGLDKDGLADDFPPNKRVRQLTGTETDESQVGECETCSIHSARFLPKKSASATALVRKIS